MKSIATITLSILIVLGTFAQEVEERSLKHFTTVKAYGPVNVILHKSNTEKATVTAEGMRTEDVELEVSGTTLRIKLKGDLFEKKTVTVDLYYTQLTEIFVAAGADAFSKTPLAEQNLTVHANSGAVIDLQFASGSIDASISEGAVAELTGKAAYLEARVSTGGILKAYTLAAANVSVRANTGGVAKVSSDGGDLDIKANLGGVVHYRGEPKNFSSEVTMGGVIRKDQR